MKLIMTLLVRDEEDILSANIEYHLSRGVDFFIVTDNLSVDSTPDILHHYRSAGVLEYLRESSDVYDQATWVTRMARIAYERHSADWIINNDADEFWWPDDVGSLKDVLRTVPDRFLGVSVQRTNFLPWTRPRPGLFFESMVVRERASVNAFGRPLPPKVCHRGVADASVAHGNHHVFVGDEPIPTCGAPLSILHFPLRSYVQFRNKIVNGGAALERNPTLPPRVGRTWRRWYEIYRSGGLPDAYARESWTEDEATARIRAGECVFDERLKDYIVDTIGRERILVGDGSGRLATDQ